MTDFSLPSARLLFGDESTKHESPHFMWGNCWLYVQTGNEPPAYAFNFQEELALYVGLLGYHPLLFVMPDSDYTRAEYRQRTDLLRSLLAVVEQRTRVTLPFPSPLGVNFDHKRQRIEYGNLTQGDDLDEQDRQLSVALLSHLTSVRYNHLTPMHTESLSHFAFSPVGRHCDPVVIEQVCELSALLMRLHDKAQYLHLTQNATLDLPPHVETTILRLSEFPEFWTDLLEKLNWSSDERQLIVKSTQDDCGDVMVYLDEADYASQMADLHRQIHVKSSNPNRPDTENCFLVQTVVQSPPETETLAGVPECFGINCFLRSDGGMELICISKQLYSDPEHKVHLGAYWSDETERNVLAKLKLSRLENLCRMFSDIGYCGPIGFDGMRDAHGGVCLIYDCNPRMTGVLPVLAVRNLLQSQGIRVREIANAGYHGAVRHDSMEGLCDWLGDRELLFTTDRPTGVLPLPNFAGCSSGLCDIVFLNVNVEAIHSIVDELRRAELLTISSIYE